MRPPPVSFLKGFPSPRPLNARGRGDRYEPPRHQGTEVEASAGPRASAGARTVAENGPCRGVSAAQAPHASPAFPSCLVPRASGAFLAPHDRSVVPPFACRRIGTAGAAPARRASPCSEFRLQAVFRASEFGLQAAGGEPSIVTCLLPFPPPHLRERPPSIAECGLKSRRSRPTGGKSRAGMPVARCASRDPRAGAGSRAATKRRIRPFAIRHSPFAGRSGPPLTRRCPRVVRRRAPRPAGCCRRGGFRA